MTIYHSIHHLLNTAYVKYSFINYTIISSVAFPTISNTLSVQKSNHSRRIKLSRVFVRHSFISYSSGNVVNFPGNPFISVINEPDCRSLTGHASIENQASPLALFLFKCQSTQSSFSLA